MERDYDDELAQLMKRADLELSDELKEAVVLANSTRPFQNEKTTITVTSSGGTNANI